MKRQLRTALMALTIGLPSAGNALAQPAADRVLTVEQPDAPRVKEQLTSLLERYPPSLHAVLALDPSLLGNQPYLATYPTLVTFLNSHPEIARNPAYYIGEPNDRRGGRPDPVAATAEMWRNILDGLAAFLGFGMAIGLVTWLIRTIIDYRRWNRLAKVQADVHTRILDRFTANDELLAYMRSPAGAKFLESSPITLDAGSRAMGAPLGRILWSVQAGVVLAAGGTGLELVSGKFTGDAAQPFNVLGYVGIALGVGFVISAVISLVISHRLGLIEPGTRPARLEPPSAL